MEMHADLTVIAGILMGGALVMVPVLGATLRFALPSILESVARARSGPGWDTRATDEASTSSSASLYVPETVSDHFAGRTRVAADG
jgi:hypothetical protein